MATDAVGDVATLVAAYLAFALAVLAAGLILEAIVRRLTGESLLGP